MTLTQLRYLVAIADAELTITLAATRVHATQPGLSKQLKLLEDELLLLVAEAFTAFLEYSAVWVFLPALPSAVRLLARWNAFTASAVPAPNLPSTLPV